MRTKWIFTIIFILFISLFSTRYANAMNVISYDDIPKVEGPITAKYNYYLPTDGYFATNCPPNGVCPTSGINDYWAGVHYTDNIRVSQPQVRSSYTSGEKMNVSWNIYPSGSTGFLAYQGYEVRYSLDNDAFQRITCLNATRTAVNTPNGVKNVCLDQKHLGILPNLLFGKNTDLNGVSYSLNVNRPRSVEFDIPRDWKGRKVRLQIIEKFYQGVSGTAGYTNMFLISYSNQISINNNATSLPPLDINPVQASISCSTLGGYRSDLNNYADKVCGSKPEECLKGGKLLTWNSPYLSGVFLKTTVEASLNSGQAIFLVGEEGVIGEGSTVAKIYYITSPQSKAVMFDAKNVYFQSGSANSQVMSPGDTIQYKIKVRRWEPYRGTGSPPPQEQTVFSNTLQFDTPRCLADKVNIQPAPKVFSSNDQSLEQKFTAITTFKPAVQSNYINASIKYCLDPNFGTGSGGEGLYYSENCAKEREIYNKYYPASLDVTENMESNSYYVNGWSKDTVLLGFLTKSLFKPTFSQNVQTGKIYYNYNFRPDRAVASAQDALNPGTSFRSSLPWLQKITGEANVTINAYQTTTSSPTPSPTPTSTPTSSPSPSPSPSPTSTASGGSSTNIFKGIFIGKELVFPTLTGRDMTIEYDSNAIKNPPPGFGDLIAPAWKERVP